MSGEPSTPRWLEKGDVVGGKYEVVRLLGRGGMGAVYEVAHVVTKKRFALKWMMPELAGNETAVERFIREAQSACALEHPNVVQVFDVDRSDEGMFAVMELLRGEPLGARFERGPLAAEQLVRLLLPLLHGLQEAHERGIIHRDLKPENLFLVRDRPGVPERPKILDFGLSKRVGHQASLTNPGMVMGTPAYMAPEQALDAPVVDARADVYAMGAILYEGLAGRVPFEAATIASLMLKVVKDTPTPPTEHVASIPIAIERIVLRCLAKRPEERPLSAEALAFALCDALRLPRDLYAPGGATTVGAGFAFESTEVELAGEPTEPDGGMALPTLTIDRADEPSERTTAPVARTGSRRGLMVFGAAATLSLAGALGWWAVTATRADATRTDETIEAEPVGPREADADDELEPAVASVGEPGESGESGEEEVPELPVAPEPPEAVDPPAETDAPPRMRMRQRPRPDERPMAMRVTPRLESGMVSVGDF